MQSPSAATNGFSVKGMLQLKVFGAGTLIAYFPQSLDYNASNTHCAPVSSASVARFKALLLGLPTIHLTYGACE